MTKRKYPSELATRTVRVNIDTWLLLKDLSLKANITMAELVDQLLTGQAIPQPVTVIPRTQLRMIPVTASIAVNGSKAAAFASKTKGVRYE